MQKKIFPIPQSKEILTTRTESVRPFCGMAGQQDLFDDFFSSFRQLLTQNYVVVWVIIFIALALVVVWPQVQQALIDLKNHIFHPVVPLPDEENAERLRLARQAQQERLLEAAKAAQEQQKHKPPKKPQKLKRNLENDPLSPWSSSGGGGGSRNIRFFRAPACNPGG